MNRTDVINFYMEGIPPPRFYLEIGVKAKSRNFNKILAENKDGVDPDRNVHCNYIMTSDEFFSKNTKKYNLIFIDGLHLYEQVYRDVNSSLKYLREKGIIIMHDCNPSSEWLQREYDLEKPGWCGTVWKAFVKMRMERENLEMFVIDTDEGLGVIKPNSSQKTFQCDEDIFQYVVFDKHRKEALNLISLDEFKKRECLI